MKNQNKTKLLFLSVSIILLFSFLSVAGQEMLWQITSDDSLVVTELGKHEINKWLSLYSVYEKECDADSTWVTISCYKNSGNMLSHYDIVGCDLSKQIYYLKRRKDSKGFIEFLRKYGEGKKSK